MTHIDSIIAELKEKFTQPEFTCGCGKVHTPAMIKPSTDLKEVVTWLRSSLLKMEREIREDERKKHSCPNPYLHRRI